MTLLVSVVVPTRGRPEHLARALGSVVGQLVPGDEVVVGIDAGDRESATVATGAGARVVEVAERGVVAKMNALAAAARNPVVVSLDDDARARPGWLEALRDAFADPSVGCAGGRDVLPWSEPAQHVVGRVARIGRVIGNHHVGSGSARDVDFLKGVNLAARRELFVIAPPLAAGGAEPYWELDVCLRARAAGWRVRYDPALVVDHDSAERVDAARTDAEAWGPVAARNLAAVATAWLPPARAAAVVLWSVVVGAHPVVGVLRWRPGRTTALARCVAATLAGRRLSGAVRRTAVPAPPRRLVAVSPVAAVGGGEVLLVDLLAGLRARGWAVTLVVAGEGPLQSIAGSRGVDVVTLPAYRVSRPLEVAATARALRRVLALRRPDDVVANMPKAHLLATAAAPRRRPVVVLLDAPDGDPIARVSRRLPGRRVAIAAEVAAASGFPDAPVVPAGVDVAAFAARALAGDRSAVRRAAGWPDDGRPLVLSVGRLQRHKGAADVVELAGRLRASGARTAIVGPDSPDEPGWRAELQRRIDREGLGDTVALVGALSADDIAAAMAEADVLVHAAARETFGLVVVEALAVGTPVVAYDAPGPRSILTRDVGRLVPVGDVEALVAAVQELVTAPPSAEVCRSVADAHDVSRSVAALEAELIGGPGLRR